MSAMKRTSLPYYSLALVCVTLAIVGCDRQPSGNASNSNGQTNSPQRPSTSPPSPQELEELKRFSPEDLLLELRARELRAEKLELPDAILERHAQEKSFQPGLRTPKINPSLAKYSTEPLVQALRFKQQVIYGVDNRQEIFTLTDPQLLKAANAVVSLFRMDRVVPLDDGINSKIVRRVFGNAYNLCPGEKFSTQPCSAYCSGVLVAPDIIATAGHCVDTPEKGTPPVTEIKFVFGYRMIDNNNAQLIINNNEVYVGKEIVARIYMPAGADWALVRLNRAVVGHDPLPVRRSEKIADAEDVYIIGHPCGLPAKFANDATVRDNSNPEFFVANLDSYGGNSGSPVFNKKTHVVEGILVRGETDFVTKNPTVEPSCQISLVCSTKDCRGEDSVRTTLFAHLIR